ncbi:UNVERIFIED_CONTAM: N-methylhydantoinase A/oxoprolinase/acetone carboxylase beta subunit [Brevibacillus sp. OAP136]
MAEIGGVRTNFRMPDLLSFGLGGGTRIRELGAAVQIGPDSVGYQLPQKGLIFGGDTLDCYGYRRRCRTSVTRRCCQGESSAETRCGTTYRRMIELVEEAIDKMKTSADPCSRHIRRRWQHLVAG